MFVRSDLDSPGRLPHPSLALSLSLRVLRGQNSFQFARHVTVDKAVGGLLVGPRATLRVHGQQYSVLVSRIPDTAQ